MEMQGACTSYPMENKLYSDCQCDTEYYSAINLMLYSITEINQSFLITFYFAEEQGKNVAR